MKTNYSNDRPIGPFQRLKNFFCRTKGNKKIEAYEPAFNSKQTASYDSKPEIEIPESEKKDASTLMTEDRFCGLIGNSQSSSNIYETLSTLSDDELFGFRYWWEHFSKISYRQDLWAAIYIYRGGCGDDSFDYFRFWLITQGRDVFYNALNNADSLCDVFANVRDEDPTDEDADYLVMDILNRRNNDSDYYYRALKGYRMPEEELPGIEFEWEEGDEESMRRVCPRTFDRWWGECR